MREEVRKIFLAGVGTAAVTCEKASEVIDKLIEKGKISVEEGKELSEELKRDFDEKNVDASKEIVDYKNTSNNMYESQIQFPPL